MNRLTLAALACLIGLSGPVLAAGGDGGGGSSPASQNCKKGEIWNEARNKCVKKQSGLLTDEQLYQQGRALAREGQYDWAIEVLELVQNQRDPRVLNYIGYSHRKAGRLDIGITYYRQALAIDPNFNLAREYLGEGYIAAGRVDLAMGELAAIEKSCGEQCDEYKQLQAAITAAN